MKRRSKGALGGGACGESVCTASERAFGGLPRCFQRGACQRGALQRIYHLSGNWEPEKYEAAYFARRKRLNTYALMALVYPEEGEHLLQLQDTVWAICDEYTWALPAHIAWRTGRDPGCIDLFSAETGFALSTIRHLLGDRLHEKMKERIDWEINRRIIRPFLYRRFWWEHSNNNWAAVCAGSVGCTFMLSRPRLFSLIRPRIAFTMRRFLSGFSADGICAEGVDYWSYGFGFSRFMLGSCGSLPMAGRIISNARRSRKSPDFIRRSAWAAA